VGAERVLARLDIQGTVSSVAFSWDGKWFAAASDQDVIHLWDRRSLRLAFTFKGHREGIGRIGFSRDNRTLISTSTDDTVRLWSVGNGQEMLSLTDYGSDTFELLLSPDDSILAVGGLVFESPPIKLWRAPSLKEIDGLLRQTGPMPAR
jgi:WD40 repeat protein